MKKREEGDYRSRNLAGTITVIIVPHKLAAPFDIT